VVLGVVVVIIAGGTIVANEIKGTSEMLFQQNRLALTDVLKEFITMEFELADLIKNIAVQWKAASANEYTTRT